MSLFVDIITKVNMHLIVYNPYLDFCKIVIFAFVERLLSVSCKISSILLIKHKGALE